MSVTVPGGFVAAGIACGIKASGDPDLAVVATDDGRPVAAAAVFTTNLTTAAPVQVSRAHLSATGGRAAGVVLNSGNANAATGSQGLADAEEMASLMGAGVGAAAEDILVCSTGLIGIPLPMEPMRIGIPLLAAARSVDGGPDAARAIMTTDTHPKEVIVEGHGFLIGGMAKGAAMLAPNMATMLAVLTTDADLARRDLHDALVEAVDRSFNALSVDGCTSTNDTVIVLASGRAGSVDAGEFRRLLRVACMDLAGQMAGDAEGATKVVRMQVTGAKSDSDARIAARKVAESQLVKCSWFGEDPYWGRVLSELGSAGVPFDQQKASVSYGGTQVCEAGVAIAYDEAEVRAHMAGRHLQVTADLGMGDGSFTILTNDLSHAYIDENRGTS